MILVLIGLVLMLAAWTVFARDAFAAVTGFVAYGLLLALAWMALGAPDVAMTEAAIGSGLTGMLLLGAAVGVQREPSARAFHWPAVILCVMVSGGLGFVVLCLPQPAPTLRAEVLAQLPATGLENPVTGVLLAFRAWDTLLEKVVVLLALVGVWSLAPESAWGGAPSVRGTPHPALRLLAQILPPVGVVVGVYIFWIGSTDPGGAFQCGTILAAMWLLVMMAGLANPPQIAKRWLRVTLVLGACVFIAVGIFGVFAAGEFLAYPESIAKPLILVVEAALTLSVAVTLGMMVAGPPNGGREQ